MCSRWNNTAAIAMWVIVCISPPHNVRAEESLWQRLQLHGFASQAVIKTNANQWFGNSTQTSWSFSEIGINGSLRLSPQLLLAGQVLSRRAGELADGSPAIDFALLDWNVWSAKHLQFGVRMGRFKNPLGLYNETRDVFFTRPSIFLPQIVYFDKVRNLALSSDGALFYGELYSDHGHLAINIGRGWPLMDTNVEYAYLFRDFDGQLQAHHPSWLAGLWYTSANERLKLGLTTVTVSTQFHSNPQAAPMTTLPAGEVEILYWIASAEYNSAQWSLSAEYCREPVSWQHFARLLPTELITAEGYYLQGVYRLRPQLDWFVRYEQGFMDHTDPTGQNVMKVFGPNSDMLAFSHIFATGLRWDINHQWSLRAEYQRHNGAFILSQRENSDFTQMQQHWNLFALQLGWRF